MNTWLLTWNPKYYDWVNPDDPFESLDNLKSIMMQTGTAIMSWSCGPTKSIRKGDRVFIMRLGEEPKGIVASGYALSDVFRLQHWNPEQASVQKNYIYVGFDKLLNPDYDDILRLTSLQIIGSSMRWTPMSSGIRIPNDVAETLEPIWTSM